MCVYGCAVICSIAKIPPLASLRSSPSRAGVRVSPPLPLLFVYLFLLCCISGREMASFLGLGNHVMVHPPWVSPPCRSWHSLSCAIHTHAPAKKSSTNCFLLYPFLLHTCSTNCHGHGYEYECHSPLVRMCARVREAPACPPVCLCACLPACAPVCPPAGSPACRPAGPPACLRARPRARVWQRACGSADAWAPA